MAASISLTRSYMLARNAYLLENQTLCDYLEQMDKEEQEQITKEEKPFNDEMAELNQAYSFKNLFKSGCCAALGLGTIIGGGKYAHDRSPSAEHKFDEMEYNRASLYLASRNAGNGMSPEEQRANLEAYKKWRLKVDSDTEKERLVNSSKDSAKWFIISALITGCTVIFCEMSAYSLQKDGLEKKYTNMINDHRYLRLQNKIGEIEKRLLHQT